MLNIQFRKQASKFLQKCPDCDRIGDRIQNLAKEPFPQDMKRLFGLKERTFRVRVGDYRILYLVEPGILLIAVIDKRSRVYD